MSTSAVTITVPAHYSFTLENPSWGTFDETVRDAQSFGVILEKSPNGDYVATGTRDDLDAWLSERVTDGDEETNAEIMASAR